MALNSPTPSLTQEILNLIAAIDEFKGRWSALKTLTPETLRHLRRSATIESVGSSTRIEGSALSDREVALLLADLRIDSFQSRDEEEVAGYSAAMEMVFESWDAIPVTEKHIRQLHRVLLEYSTKDTRHRGEYKNLSNSVAAFDATGKHLGVIFETATPFETPLEMEKLMRWFESAGQEGGIHPLLSIGIFVVWFLAIHPFQDGNGRLSRVLTTLMLLRRGYAYVPYSSLESVIEENKTAYYAALRKTQGTMRQPEVDWEPWLVFFLRCLTRQKDRLSKRLEEKTNQLGGLSELAVKIVNLLAAGDRVTVATVVRATGTSRNTVKATLQGLVKRGLIARHGKQRGTYYTVVS